MSLIDEGLRKASLIGKGVYFIELIFFFGRKTSKYITLSRYIILLASTFVKAFIFFSNLSRSKDVIILIKPQCLNILPTLNTH